RVEMEPRKQLPSDPGTPYGAPRTVLVTKSTSSVSGGGLKLDSRLSDGSSTTTSSASTKSSSPSRRSTGSEDSGRGSRKEENPYADLTSEDYFSAKGTPHPPRMPPPPPPQDDPYYVFRRILPAKEENPYGEYGSAYSTAKKEEDYGSAYGTTKQEDYGSGKKKEESPYRIYEGFKRRMRR
ncbi:hypothetical protein PMAYCL1PPCAC_10395, partial [Pristionchus mayeri]